MIHAKNLNKSGKKLPGGKGENSLSPADIGLASKKQQVLPQLGCLNVDFGC